MLRTAYITIVQQINLPPKLTYLFPTTFNFSLLPLVFLIVEFNMPVSVRFILTDAA